VELNAIKMREYLLNTAYYFFPKNIIGLDDNYMQQDEIQKLNNHLKKSIENEYKIWKNIIFEFNKNSKYNAIDYTNFLINQPSLHLKIVIKNDGRFLEIFNLYSSLVIPYYYFSENKYDNFEKLYVGKAIVNNQNNRDEELIKIINTIALKFDKQMLQEKYLNLKIPQISFETINEGDFTVMNAFFNHKHINR
jgi:hypothetical protein